MDTKLTQSVTQNKPSKLVEKRRTQLIEAATSLFSRVGYHAATVKGVSDTAGVSAGLIYQYVADKHELLFACLTHIVERNREEIPSALQNIDEPLSRLHTAVYAYARVIADNPRAVQLTYRESKSLRPDDIETLKRMELETNTLIANCIDECIRSSLLTPMHIELLVYRMIFAAHAWDLKHWRLHEITSFDNYVNECIHSCWTVYLTAKGKRLLRRLQQQDEDSPLKNLRIPGDHR